MRLSCRARHLHVAIVSILTLCWTLPSQAAAAADAASLTPFATPNSLESAVTFWSQVFLRHTSDQVVLHDRENMDVVWGVLDLPKDPVTGAVDERVASRFTRMAIDELRRRLQRLELDPTALDDEDNALLTLASVANRQADSSSADDRQMLKGASTRIRAQRGVADQFRVGLQRCRTWLKDIRQILREEGVPEEVAALPFVESMFNPQARSSVGAAGVWQLMPATARGLGLRVNRRSDDRVNVLKATRAAARMLRSNYVMLGSWPLAITAYNHGPNGLRRAVREVGSSNLTDLIDNYQRATWGFASKNFYAEFLAALDAVNSGDAAGVAPSATPAVGPLVAQVRAPISAVQAPPSTPALPSPAASTPSIDTPMTSDTAPDISFSEPGNELL